MRPIFCPNSMCKTSNNNKMCRRWRKTTSDKTSNSLSIAHSNSYFFVAYRKTAVTLFKKKLVCYFIVCALNGALNLRENYISCFVCCSFIALQEKFKLLLEWSQCQSAFVHTQIEREREIVHCERDENGTHEMKKQQQRVAFDFHQPTDQKCFMGFQFFFLSLVKYSRGLRHWLTLNYRANTTLRSSRGHTHTLFSWHHPNRAHQNNTKTVLKIFISLFFCVCLWNKKQWILIWKESEKSEQEPQQSTIDTINYIDFMMRSTLYTTTRSKYFQTYTHTHSNHIHEG